MKFKLNHKFSSSKYCMTFSSNKKKPLIHQETLLKNKYQATKPTARGIRRAKQRLPQNKTTS